MKKRAFLNKLVEGKAFLLGMLILAVLIITYIIQPGSFTRGNAIQILSNVSYLGVMGIGVACLLMCGGFDLSTSAHATFGMLIFAQIMQWSPDLPWFPVALLPLIFGVIAGGFNAFLAEKLHLMPFIATIGMGSIWTGLAQWYTKGNQIPIRSDGFAKMTAATIGRLPIPIIFAFVILLVIAYSIMLKRTRFGRSVLMVGGNPAAARLAGLNPRKIRTIMYMNNGVLAAISGLIWASQQKMCNPTGLTSSMPEIVGLTAAILGGVSFMGGAGKLSGAFFGVFLIQILQYALQAMNLPLWFVTMVNGSLLVIALTIDALTTSRHLKGVGPAGMPGVK